MQTADKLAFWLKLVFLGLCLLLLGRWIFSHHASVAPPTSVLVRAVPVARQDVPIKLNVVGTVVPYQAVDIKSRIDSQILKVPFVSGAEIKAGQTLFLLDDRDLRAQLKQAEANLLRDTAQLNNLTWVQQGNEKVFQKKAISAQVFEAGKAALESQKAIVLADQANIQDLKVQLDYAKVVSPINGRAGTINLTLGNNVKANDVPLVTINQLKPIFVQASLPQRYFDTIIKAMKSGPVSVTALRDGSSEATKGTLEYINNTIDVGTGTFAVRAVFQNTREYLWPGMLVQLQLHIGEDKQALVIPAVAVQQSPQGGEFVFVVENNKAQKRPITLLRIEQDLAIIGAGLKEKEQVVTDGLMSLRPGTSVLIQPKEKYGPL